MNDPMAAIRELSYLFRDPPEPGHAMARLEIVTGGGSTGLSLDDIRVDWINGRYRASIEDEDLTWEGLGDSTIAAVIALLAYRATGHRATVQLESGEGEDE